MLRVFCLESELADVTGGVALGDRLDRWGSELGGGAAFSGTEFEDVVWVLDRDAVPVGGRVGRVTGIVVAIDAVYVGMTAEAVGGWSRVRASARAVPRGTTAGTPRGPERVKWTTEVYDDSTGRRLRGGFRSYLEGEKVLEGWLITLSHEHVHLQAVDY